MQIIDSFCYLQEEQEARQKKKDGLNSSGNGSTDESDELNESELIELPYFLHKLFDWLLDHHAVSNSYTFRHLGAFVKDTGVTIPHGSPTNLQNYSKRLTLPYPYIIRWMDPNRD